MRLFLNYTNLFQIPFLFFKLASLKEPPFCSKHRWLSSFLSITWSTRPSKYNFYSSINFKRMQNVTKKCICIVLQKSIIRNKNSKIYFSNIQYYLVHTSEVFKFKFVTFALGMYLFGRLNNCLKYIWEVVNLGFKSCDCFKLTQFDASVKRMCPKAKR